MSVFRSETKAVCGFEGTKYGGLRDVRLPIIDSLKVSGTKEELGARVENAKRAEVTPAGESRVRVPRGTLYCCVPLCHSFTGKVVNGKPVKLHRLPLDLQLRRQWIGKIRIVRKKLSSKSRNTHMQPSLERF